MYELPVYIDSVSYANAQPLGKQKALEHIDQKGTEETIGFCPVLRVYLILLYGIFPESIL